MEMDLHQVIVRDHQHTSTNRVDVILELTGITGEPCNQELGAVAPGFFVGVHRVQVGDGVFRFFLYLDLLPAHASVEAVEDNRDAQTTGIHHSGVSQHAEKLGRSFY